MALLLAIGATAALGACGGGGDDPSEVDREYVAAFCEATRIFEAESKKLGFRGSASEPSETLAKMAPVFSEWAKGLAKAGPPDDFADYHSGFVRAVQAAARALEGRATGDAFRALEAYPPPDQGIAARLDEYTRKDPDCTRASMVGSVNDR